MICLTLLINVSTNFSLLCPFAMNFIKERAPWEMNNRERIEEAGRKKEEGNLLFKAGKFRRAEKKYDKVAARM